MKPTRWETADEMVEAAEAVVAGMQALIDACADKEFPPEFWGGKWEMAEA